MYGIFFVFISGLMLLVENTIKRKQHDFVLALEWVVYIWHLICGTIFFMMLYRGGYFYV
jgi:hypothetical protein